MLIYQRLNQKAHINHHICSFGLARPTRNLHRLFSPYVKIIRYGCKKSQAHSLIFIARSSGKNLYMFQQGAHNSTLVTLSHEHLVTMAPNVTFIHTFPGSVKSGIGRDATGMFKILKSAFAILAPLLDVPNLETGERHLFMATSARYRCRQQQNDKDSKESSSDGVSLLKDGSVAQVARGVNGEIGSGAYSLNWNGESASSKIEKLVERYRKEGMIEQIWRHVEGEFERITGSIAI